MNPLNVPPAVAPSPPAHVAATPAQPAAGGTRTGPAPLGHPAGYEPAAGPVRS
jgi:hypothetical protein